MAKRKTRKRAEKSALPTVVNVGGQPTVWNDEVEKRLFQALEWGAPVRIACDAAGIGERTFFDRQTVDADFKRRVGVARAHCAVEYFGVLRRAAFGVKNKTGAFVLKPEWQAAARFLEGIYPELFARRIVGTYDADPNRAMGSEMVAKLRDDELDRHILNMLCAPITTTSRPS